MHTVYRNTQVGIPILVLVDAVIVCLIYLGLTEGSGVFFTTAAALAILEALFAWMTIEGTESTLQLRFGIGLIRKQFRLSEIVEALPYRTAWWQGWGIHLSRAGTVYNISGLDAILLKLQNGKQVIIGTNDRDRLLAYIHQYTSL